MLEPESKLPWIITYPLTDSYSILDSKNQILQDTTDYYDWACTTTNAEYIVQAANGFPEAVRLLVEYRDMIRDSKGSMLDTYRKINEFLTKLEEDEKDN